MNERKLFNKQRDKPKNQLNYQLLFAADLIGNGYDNFNCNDVC